MTSSLVEIGAAWVWALLGLALAVGEALAPGIFLIWFGLAALATAALVAVIAPACPVPWPIQLLLFAALALLAAAMTWWGGASASRRPSRPAPVAGGKATRPGASPARTSLPERRSAWCTSMERPWSWRRHPIRVDQTPDHGLGCHKRSRAASAFRARHGGSPSPAR